MASAQDRSSYLAIMVFGILLCLPIGFLGSWEVAAVALFVYEIFVPLCFGLYLFIRPYTDTAEPANDDEAK